MASVKKKNNKPVLSIYFKMVLVLLIIEILCFACVQFNKDNLIINFHYQGYKVIKNTISIFILFASVLLLIAFLKKIHIEKQSRKNKAEAAMYEKDEANRNRKKNAFLSVSGELDSALIQSILLTESEKEWNIVKTQIDRLCQQLKEMDIYQEKLSRLLIKNGAEALDNTQEILDKVEQYLCRNVRKCINYLDVADLSDENDVIFIKGKLQECFEDNQDKLRQIDEFLRSIVEFLNFQGDEEAENSIELLNIYKNTILDSLK